MVQTSDYAGATPSWCPGCGNFGILSAVKKALVDLQLEPGQALMVSGIGQAGKLPHYTRSHLLNGLHGRAIPAAAGAKLANPELAVLVIAGDGDCYGEGGNHFIHAMRRNDDITCIVHDNQVYALTKGQASPTSDYGFVTKTTPQGAAMPENPIALAVAMNAPFVARAFAGDIDHLAGLIKLGVQRKGFALIDVLQPCVTFNHQNTFAWYRERVYKLEQNGYDPRSRTMAFEKAQEWGERIPIGIIYETERPTLAERLPALKNGMALARQRIDPARVERLFDEFV